MNIDLDGLMQAATERFQLGPDSIHGPKHWQAVQRNGLVLAGALGADRDIVQVFALTHDACRNDEDHDPWHGHRAAEWVRDLNGVFFYLSPDRMKLLQHAIRRHAGGTVAQDETTDACWSADRWQLIRPGVGIVPKREYFTEASWAVVGPALKAIKTGRAA
jgi:uncharacterized protein